MDILVPGCSIPPCSGGTSARPLRGLRHRPGHGAAEPARDGRRHLQPRAVISLSAEIIRILFTRFIFRSQIPARIRPSHRCSGRRATSPSARDGCRPREPNHAPASAAPWIAGGRALRASLYVIRSHSCPRENESSLELSASG